MKLKLFDFWRSFLDLIQGKRDFIYELSFMTCAINIIIGIVVICTGKTVITLIAALVGIIAGITGVIASVVPHRRIMMFVDSITIFVLFYAGFQMINGHGYAQLSSAFYIIITLLYVWRFAMEGLKDGGNSTRDAKVVK